MRNRYLVYCLSVLALFAAPTASFAGASASEHRQATPPIGFVKFCARNPGECKNVAREPVKIAMTPELWTEVYQINNYVNAKIKPVSDQDLYGQPEYWTYPKTAGDCEDYLLLKKRYLEGMGFEPQSLLITVVLDEKAEGHAVLTLAGTDGDFILDNRRNDVLRWTDTGYTFLKRQAEGNAAKWMALAESPKNPAVASGKK